MSGWLVVGLVGLATVAIKGAGPVALGGRRLPPSAERVIGLLAPAVLAALVVVQALGDGRRVSVDERLAGLAAAALALALRAPVLLAVVVASAVTALLRL